ncbi:MAG TPA: hypothetical protein VIV60_18665 [Polyangiaceae bacterium]
MSEVQSSRIRLHGVAWLCLSLPAVSCGTDRDIVAIVDENSAGAAYGGLAGGNAGGTSIGMPAGGIATGGMGTGGIAIGGAATGGAATGGIAIGGAATGGAATGGIAIGGAATGGAATGGIATGGTNTASGLSVPVGAVGNTNAGVTSTAGGNSGASATWVIEGGAFAQTDISSGGSLGTLVFTTDPGTTDPSTENCFCVPPDGPTLCSLENRTDFPICGEGCASAAPDCIGSCPCGQWLTDSTGFELIECLSHPECGPTSACLMVEDFNTHELLASHCL